MTGLFTKNEWLNCSICSIIGLIMLYNYSSGNSIPIVIMLPISMIGAISFYLFLRDNHNNEQPKIEVVEQ